MPKKYKFIKIQSPLTSDQIEIIANLMSQGGEVLNKNIKSRLSNIHLAILVYNESNEPIAISAIKKVNPRYRDKIFTKAITEEAQNFNYESGYSYVKSEYRKLGIFKQMKRLMLSDFNENIYATTKENNLAVIHSLEKFGFRKNGQAFQSTRGDYNLILLIRNKK